MTKDKILKMVPNMLTLFNGLLGFTAVVVLAWSDFSGKILITGALVVCSAGIDFLDGYLARKFNASSDFGMQLDSFADLISFGFAPIFMLLYLAHGLGFYFVLPVSALYMIAGVYRLARYNVNDFSLNFMGLPITAAGVILAGFCVVYFLWGGGVTVNTFIVAAVVLCVILSVLMVSKVRIKRF